MKSRTLREITEDEAAGWALVEGAVGEDGEPRDLTGEEARTVYGWLDELSGEFRDKCESAFKFVDNLRHSAAVRSAEARRLRELAGRVQRAADAEERNAARILDYVGANMALLKMDRVKTELHAAAFRKLPAKVSVDPGADLSAWPEEFLKEREPLKSAVMDAVRSGSLSVSEGGCVEGLPGARVESGTALRLS